jgi:hypothetical protein
MRRLVFTCVFGGYDRVYPPVIQEPELDYVLVTDDDSVRVPGWRNHVVDISVFPNAKAANLHYRALIHRELPSYDLSLYVDGNIRLIGMTSRFFEPFLASGKTLGVFPHPLRRTVTDEADACIKAEKVREPQRVSAELAAYVADGFPDDQGLIETTIMLQDHRAAELDPAMSLWWCLFEKHLTRDQLSLPYVRWKTGVSCMYQDFSFRQPNPYFALYPHWKAADVPVLYTHLSARSHDSVVHRALLRLWEFTWAVRRSLRRTVGKSATKVAP